MVYPWFQLQSSTYFFYEFGTTLCILILQHSFISTWDKLLVYQISPQYKVGSKEVKYFAVRLTQSNTRLDQQILYHFMSMFDTIEDAFDWYILQLIHNKVVEKIPTCNHSYFDISLFHLLMKHIQKGQWIDEVLKWL